MFEAVTTWRIFQLEEIERDGPHSYEPVLVRIYEGESFGSLNDALNFLEDEARTQHTGMHPSMVGAEITVLPVTRIQAK